VILLSAVLWLSLGTGTCASLAALYGRYRTLPEIISGPLACETVVDGCNTLFRKKEAKLLGIPNAFLGIILYLFLATGLIAGCPLWLLIFAASFGLAMSIHLGFNLIKNRRQCRICWIGHVSNSVIWFCLLIKLIVLRG
jgi:uncharacterized membrane protein